MKEIANLGCRLFLAFLFLVLLYWFRNSKRGSPSHFTAFSNILGKFNTLNFPQLPDIGQKIEGVLYINEKSHNSRTSDDIDMKLGSLNKSTIETQKCQIKLMMTLFLVNYDIIVIFPIYFPKNIWHTSHTITLSKCWFFFFNQSVNFTALLLHQKKLNIKSPLILTLIFRLRCWNTWITKFW